MLSAAGHFSISCVLLSRQTLEYCSESLATRLPPELLAPGLTDIQRVNLPSIGVNRLVTDPAYDAFLLVSFGGPEGPDDVIPFLENVLRGRGVPRERMLEVAEHYQKFGGISPINAQCRELLAAVQKEFDNHNIELPIYWGNRNWHPLLTDTMQQIRADGKKRVLAFVTSAFSSYSGCRQYREDIQRALQTTAADDICVDKLRVFYNHPDFISVNAENVNAAIRQLTGTHTDASADVRIAFTAHSLPASMAQTCDYEQQLRETCRLVAEACSVSNSNWELVYQSRSGRPQDPWLEPDICDYLKSLSAQGVRKVVISPIGFLSDHVEVLYDLDDEAAGVCTELGIDMVRAATPGHHPQFARMIRHLVEERLYGTPPLAIGQFGPRQHVCAADCCPAPKRRPTATTQGSRTDSGDSR